MSAPANLSAVSEAMPVNEQNYDLAVAALSDLGFGEGDGVPAFEQVYNSLNEADRAWLEQRQAAGHKDTFIISPNAQVIGLLGAQGLIERFDQTRSADRLTGVRTDLWEQFKDKDPEHDGAVLFQPFLAAVLLGDVVDPRNPKQPANAFGEPGLVYINMTVSEQRAALWAEKQSPEMKDRRLRTASVSQIVAINAQRRQAGLPLLDQRTHTRLVRYPDRIVDGVPQIPRIRAVGSTMGLGASRTKLAWSSKGVRRALHIPVRG